MICEVAFGPYDYSPNEQRRVLCQQTEIRIKKINKAARAVNKAVRAVNKVASKAASKAVKVAASRAVSKAANKAPRADNRATAKQIKSKQVKGKSGGRHQSACRDLFPLLPLPVFRLAAPDLCRAGWNDRSFDRNAVHLNCQIEFFLRHYSDQ